MIQGCWMGLFRIMMSFILSSVMNMIHQ